MNCYNLWKANGTVDKTIGNEKTEDIGFRIALQERCIFFVCKLEGTINTSTFCFLYRTRKSRMCIYIDI